jgi:zinc and cadmium transporter
MAPLGWIVASCLLGGVLSVSAAAAMAYRARPSAVPILVSYSVGALLGAAFLAVLPHALEALASPTTLGASVLAGLLVFFVLEKLVLWRHQHAPQWGEDQRLADHKHVHAAPGGRSGMLIMIGDTVHNFVDGILIAAAFLANTQLGIVTALAIMAHEVPSEVGDFLILLHSGYARAKAFALNVLSSLGTLVGGLLGYFALGGFESWEPVVLGVVAASMIYVAVADLIPGLHRRPELRDTAWQALLIALGIGAIAGLRLVLAH